MVSPQTLNPAADFPEFTHSVRVYSSNSIIRSYTGWPAARPLPFAMPHSYCPGIPCPDYCVSPLKYYWVYGDRHADLMLKNGYIGPKYLARLGHPILYLQEPKSQERSGTLSMPDHMVGSEKLSENDFHQYCIGLMKLPEKFHPIYMSITPGMMPCLPICQQYGIKTIILDQSHPMFLQFLRETCGRCKYATSNYLGSPMWLSQLSGCLYFYYGQSFITNDDKLIPCYKEHEALYSIENVHDDLDHKEDLVDTHLGRSYKSAPDRLRARLDEWAKDYCYVMLTKLQTHFGHEKFLDILATASEGCPRE